VTQPGADAADHTCSTIPAGPWRPICGQSPDSLVTTGPQTGTFGKSLPDNPPDQWKRGKRVRKKSNLRPGDLVFFDENRNGKLQPWDHVGIYSGNGYLVHASGYFGEVVESKMKYIRGYWGAKRFRKLH
jgi:hypothetical protein